MTIYSLDVLLFLFGTSLLFQPVEDALGSVNLRSPWDPTWDLGLAGRGSEVFTLFSMDKG